MPVTRHALTGKLTSIIGPLTAPRAVLRSMQREWLDTVDKTVALGPSPITLTADARIVDLTLPDTGDTGLQYEVIVEYMDPLTRDLATWFSGAFEMEAPADLADKAQDTSVRVSPSLGDQLAARIDGGNDHGDVSGVLTLDADEGTHALDATGPLLITLDPTAPDFRIITLYVASGADQITVDGISDLELTDGAFASFVRIRGAWVLASAGGASTGPADTTPPTAVTDLVATGGEGQVVLTWSAATDDESTVKYGWKVWLTSSTEPTAYTTVTVPGVTIPDLPAGNYTAKVYSFSNGGTTTADTATATVTTPPGWNTILSDTFTAADGTPLAGRVVDGATWVNADGFAVIESNKVVLKSEGAPVSNGDATLPTPAAAGSLGIEIRIDSTMLSQPNSSEPYLHIQVADWPGISAKGGNNRIDVQIQGYNAGSGFGTLVPLTAVSSAPTGRWGLRKTGNLFEVLNGAGETVASLDVQEGYSGYKDKPIGGSVTLAARDFISSAIDAVEIRVLT